MINLAADWNNLPKDHEARSTKLPWYHKTIEYQLRPPFVKLLEEWSNVAPDDVIQHIYRARRKAWRVFPWPCIGEFWFVEQGLRRHPDYSDVLKRMTSSNSRFLDIGSCLGQDIRTLAHDGAPTSNLYGVDVLPGFKDVGYILFRDSDRIDPSHFITSNIFTNDLTGRNDLTKTRGTWDIIHVSMFLHLFELPEQEAALKNIMRLLKPIPGSTILGTEPGSLEADVAVQKAPFCDLGKSIAAFRHSRESLKSSLEKVADALILEAKVWTAYDNEVTDEIEAGHRRNRMDSEIRLFNDHKERRILFRVDLI
ncbi:hypothetical protein M426DRAFT_64670 [Hypoxylon sp. CI-4A]|nr:hypothetical protein M426DRAFT_64670 [Hypoxylon sp. CI-4A]